MYTLDFETMMQVMQGHRKTGLLYADVPAGTAGIREPCRIEIKLEAGNMVSCFLITESGQRLTQGDAIKRIARFGTLHWDFLPQAAIAPPALPAPRVIPSPENTLFPRRIASVEQWQMQSWPHLHRRIFVLADGTRSLAKIAEILSVPPVSVERVLRDLQSIRVIEILRYEGSDR